MVAPERRGFGTQMIERAVFHQLRGVAEIRYEPGGVVCRLALPVGESGAEEAFEAVI